jgi:hypothetical protein
MSITQAPSLQHQKYNTSEPQIFWNEGSGLLQGQYGPERFWDDDMAQWTQMSEIPPPSGPDLLPPSKKRQLSKRLAEMMDQHLPQCIAQAAGLSELPNPISIIHNGIAGDSNHSPKSLHSLNRAIDISDIRFVDNKGRQHNYLYAFAAQANRLRDRDLLKNATKLTLSQEQFFNKLVDCWKSAGGAVVTCTDPRHQGHLHLSVPMGRAKQEGFEYDSRFYKN